MAEHGLSVPPEIAGAFRALATIEGTLTQLAPGFDILMRYRNPDAARLGEWLADGNRASSAVVDPFARDYAIRDFKRYLKLERRWRRHR